MEEDLSDLPIQRFGLIYMSHRLMDMLVRGGGKLNENDTWEQRLTLDPLLGWLHSSSDANVNRLLEHWLD